jgi:polyhydroxyalkanoate synthesis repressor PhaR
VVLVSILRTPNSSNSQLALRVINIGGINEKARFPSLTGCGGQGYVPPVDSACLELLVALKGENSVQELSRSASEEAGRETFMVLMVELSGEILPEGGSLVNQEIMANKANVRTKIIKRYQNRKLYDTQQSCYVTLDDIAKMIRNNEDVMVIDNKTKNDITAATLTQIIFEAEKKASQYAPLFTLREIIQNGNGSISAYLAKLGAFPKDYAYLQPTPVVAEKVEPVEISKISTDDIKQSLEERVATAASAATQSSGYGGNLSEITPDLPNSNKSLNN